MKIVKKIRRRGLEIATLGDMHVNVGGQRSDPAHEIFRLIVVYNGYLQEVERALMKAVGRLSDGSGVWIGLRASRARAGKRDHEWYFTKRAAALRALCSVRALRVGKVKIESWLVGPIEP